MRFVSNMTDINAVKDQGVLAVTPLLLRCINNFIYCRLLENYPFHSFFIGKTCGISDEAYFGNVTKPVIQSLKADFITLSHSLFFDHPKKALFKTTKYKNCEEYKSIQEFVEPVFKPLDHSKPLNTWSLPNFTGGIYGKVCDQRLPVGDY